MNRTNRPRDPKQVVLEAELVASSSERVRGWLETTAADKATLFANDEGIEQALLGRNDPLINLSLARFSANPDILRALYTGAGKTSKPIRLALLMNEVARRIGSTGMPDVLVERDEAVGGLLSDLDEEELLALFSNPELENDFLINFFEQKGPWQALDERRQQIALRALYKNSRLTTRYSGPMDGYAEYLHDKVFSAAWELAGKLPTSIDWAASLCWLYEKLKPVGGVKEPLLLAARWIPDKTDAKRLESEDKQLARGDLGPFARTRRGLARLAVHQAHTKEQRQALAAHEDPAVRSAYYFEGGLSADEMKAANERDFLLSFESLVWNPRAWCTKETRQVLHDMAWDSKRDPSAHMDSPNLYNARLERCKEEHPDWFKDEEEVAEDEQDSGALPLTSGEFATALEQINQSLFTANDLGRSTYVGLLTLLKRTAWLGWGIALVLAAVLIFKH
jgi:hypothetical protein